MMIAMVSEHASPTKTAGSPEVGGQNVFVANLSTCLADRGHDVTIYTRRDSPDLPVSADIRPGVKVIYINAGPALPISKDELFPFMEGFAEELKNHWRKWRRPCVVHGHYWMSGYAVLKAITALQEESHRIPFIQTYHSLGTIKRRTLREADKSNVLREDIERMVAFAADQIIATCSEESAEWRRIGVPNSRLSIVPCGVDVLKFNPYGPIEDRDVSKFRVLSVSRLVLQKGVDLVIKAVAALANQGCDIELLVVGGLDKAHISKDAGYLALRGLAHELNIVDRVRFCGGLTQNELAPLYRSADVVVCASWYEPFGIVPLEAMASQRAVVASRCGGFLDTVVDGHTGLHITPQSEGDLIQALRTLAYDPKLCAEYGLAGRRRTEAVFSWHQIAIGYEDVYRRFS